MTRPSPPPLRTPIGSPGGPRDVAEVTPDSGILTPFKIPSRLTKGRPTVAIGIYQNTVYGTAAHLPFSYTVAVVLGSLHFSRDTLQSQDECSQLQHDIDKL
ncbi:hypothetical protein O3P69_009730 [Scylla paramamosain]|uniref:Uncharacterized protein n=1 Tax=Scylla paramamosain TaxID=85552 RepID=A0AAW0SES5_SCYPA